MPRITLDQANAIIVGALKSGVEQGLKPLTVAVLDAGGHVIALQRQDGASTLRPQIAVAKAAGALALGVSSRQIAVMADARPSFVSALVPMSASGIVPAAGGLIAVDAAGEVIGAVGVTGDHSDNDERCSQAGLAFANLKAQV